MFRIHRLPPVRLMLLAAAAVLTLSGCGAPAGTAPPAEPSPTGSSGTPGTGDTAGSVRATPPGTELRLGERAVLPFRDGVIGVTVTAVDAGDRAAFRRQYGERAAGIVPYYIRYEVENVDGSDLSYSSGPSLGLVTAHGGPTGAVVSGSMPDCERANAPKGFTRAGATFSSCHLSGAAGRVEITGAEFDMNAYRDAPVSWRR
ncbi:hypothetical protein [Nonomuraea sp. SBT364]|uniref:hypothetical protein n=1 Tax=Nonomuraea sp. SBT364 TaxID=1580530 RepID=UPI00066B0315|nr:hypothetical protein [Nonomuraea sp. SBT364]